MSVQLVSKISNLCGPDPPTLQPDGQQTDRQTDGWTTCDGNTALCTIVHRTVKMSVKSKTYIPVWRQRCWCNGTAGEHCV